jgi:hypothetical protein
MSPVHQMPGSRHYRLLTPSTRDYPSPYIWGITVVGDKRLLRIDISVFGEAGRNANDGTLRRAASPRERRIIGLGGCASDWPTVYFENAFFPIKLSAREDFCDRLGIRAGAVGRDSRERAAARTRAGGNARRLVGR